VSPKPQVSIGPDVPLGAPFGRARATMDGMRRTAFVRVVVALVVAGLVAGLVFVVIGGGSSGDSSAVALPTSPTALPTVSNDQFKGMLRDLEGTVVVVNIWASWCGPCIKEAPGLAQLAKQYANRVQFLGVDIEDQLTPARAFIRRYGWTYPSVGDPQGEIKRGYGFMGQPDTIVYDAGGKRVWAGAGAVEASDLQAAIEQALASAPPG
jgi:cytochrome c biogenesis protein CcmG/thiol:disulfide interchange protein DsbE